MASQPGRVLGNPKRGSVLLSKHRDAADPLAGQGEDYQPHCVAGTAVRVADVGTEGRLAVGASGDELPAPPAAEGDRGVETGSEVAATDSAIGS
jgi:hypothetical protein